MDNLLLIEFLIKRNEELEKRVRELEERIRILERKKDSSNSSIPPSKDENRPFRNKSLRERSGKKAGGQQGHKGTTLKMIATPDEITEHIPEYCNCCGKSLKDREAKFVEKRQIADLPVIQIKIIEHLIYKKRCQCGHETISVFKDGMKNRLIYGKNIEALASYFSVRQYIPFKRLEEIFRDVFQASISSGSLYEMIKRAGKKALPVYNLIKEKISQSKKVGTDETGAKVNGKMHWFWTWQNDNLTFITLSDNRGLKTISEHFEDGFKNAVLVHDCWKSHFQTKAQSHQICVAHLLRELKYLTQLYKDKWSVELTKLLKFALEHKRQMNKSDYYSPHPKTQLIEKCLKELLEKHIDEKHKELITFRNRIEKYREYLFTFLYYPDVPPDNNGSERAIRNIKPKLKISGQFKSSRGGQDYAIIRSVMDTAIKNDQKVLPAFLQIVDSS